MFAAVKEGNVKELADLMRKDPGFDVNGLGEDGGALLSLACSYGRDDVIPLLLAPPEIDVNLEDSEGFSPVMSSCFDGRTSCVRELLKDSRVKVNEADNYGCTPVFLAALYGYLDVIKWWIASGRELDLGEPGNVYNTDVIGIATKYDKTEMVALLERFKENMEETRHVMRTELGWYDEAAAEMFALVVFVTDEFLQVKDTPTTPPARFFNIVNQLPLELQMVICYRFAGSSKEIIPGHDSEVAFKELAQRLLWSSFFTTG